VTTPQNINVDEFEMHWINMFKNVSLLIEEAVTNKWLQDVFSLYAKDNCIPSNDSMNPGCEELVLKLIDRSRICSDRYPFSLYRSVARSSQRPFSPGHFRECAFLISLAIT
jgi:hypothetical protein